MQISNISKICNYRNLSGIQMDFHECINFIVGKNNVGKTNLLDLLNKLMNIGKFDVNDFLEVTEPIEIEFQLKYSPEEVGYFEDNFDIEDSLKISIIAKQQSVDDRIEFFHKDSESFISPRKIKGLNFIYYSSLRTPSKELNFNKKIGTGKVLSYLMKSNLKNESLEDNDLIERNKIKNVIDKLNIQIEKLNGLSNEKIEAYINDNNENLINRIVEIGDDSKRNLNDLGDGVRYGFNIFLNILDLLVHLKTTTREENYEQLMISMPDNKKYLPLILGLDEPEIHQHPYRQRALIKSIRKIVNNMNREFGELLKDLFNIDGFLGQIFVVTHSPNILLDNYKEIIRLHIQNGFVKATSGTKIDFEPKTHKHLVRSFAYIKEAMFSESVLLVEGDTEFGAIPIFANRMGYDIDENGVGIVKLDGADSVKRCLELYKAFEIKATAIIDKDKEDSYLGEQNVYFTDKIDFEEEVYSHFTLQNYIKYLIEVDRAKSIVSVLKKEIPSFDAREFIANPESYIIEPSIGSKVIQIIEQDQIDFLSRNKTAINGALLATHVNEIPNCFSSVIEIALRSNSNE